MLAQVNDVDKHRHSLESSGELVNNPAHIGKVFL